MNISIENFPLSALIGRVPLATHFHNVLLLPKPSPPLCDKKKKKHPNESNYCYWKTAFDLFRMRGKFSLTSSLRQPVVVSVIYLTTVTMKTNKFGFSYEWITTHTI